MALASTDREQDARSSDCPVRGGYRSYDSCSSRQNEKFRALITMLEASCSDLVILVSTDAEREAMGSVRCAGGRH